MIVAGYGLAITHVDGNPNGTYRPDGKVRVVVSGATFAHKTLYGFIVKGGRKVLGRFKLGVADACGYAQTKAVVHPVRGGGAGPTVRTYVNAGPTFDKAHAVKSSF
ncbi:MAG: hypothetical protein JWM31_179 [Solirubrobacterales bacterium]|nr:hypothetical protein [Solirubrobacterales bacterium]